MTRIHYVRLAEAMRESAPGKPVARDPHAHAAWNLQRSQWITDCNAIATMLAKQSQGFDRIQFLKNCGATL